MELCPFLLVMQYKEKRSSSIESTDTYCRRKKQNYYGEQQYNNKKKKTSYDINELKKIDMLDFIE